MDIFSPPFTKQLCLDFLYCIILNKFAFVNSFLKEN
nr:MAG TPA: hypothetical protein [Caudoviricetes sp.]